MDADQLPPGFEKNSPLQMAQLHEAAQAALRACGPSIHAVAIVIVLPDGGVTAALGGDPSDLQALAKLAAVGGDVLTETVKRFLAGKGTTRIVPR